MSMITKDIGESRLPTLNIESCLDAIKKVILSFIQSLDLSDEDSNIVLRYCKDQESFVQKLLL